MNQAVNGLKCSHLIFLLHTLQLMFLLDGLRQSLVISQFLTSCQDLLLDLNLHLQSINRIILKSATREEEVRTTKTLRCG